MCHHYWANMSLTQFGQEWLISCLDQFDQSTAILIQMLIDHRVKRYAIDIARLRALATQPILDFSAGLLIRQDASCKVNMVHGRPPMKLCE